MKSINEFATEYAQDKYMPVQTSQAVKAGANYVLKCIEELIPNDEVLQNNVICQSAIFIIQTIIEQLKK